MDKIYGGSGITAFQISRSDMFSNAFAVSLKIKQQHRITGMKKKFGLIYQLQSVGANSVHQNDNAFIRLPGNKPAVQFCATGAWKLDRLNRQISRWLSNFTIIWSDKNIPFMPGKQSKCQSSNRKNACDKF